MSLLLLAIYWLVIPGLAFLVLRGLWRKTKTSAQKGMVATVGVLGLLALAAYLGGAEKGRLDRQVRELCAKDGGVKVYETVRLPAEKFDQYGQVRIPSKQDAKPEDQYFYYNQTVYLREGNPSLRRSHTTIVRGADGMVLGEAVSYHRVGGDLPGPWHSSSFACPNPSEINLENAVFTREILK